jgi:hypothetical protein
VKSQKKLLESCEKRRTSEQHANLAGYLMMTDPPVDLRLTSRKKSLSSGKGS